MAYVVNTTTPKMPTEGPPKERNPWAEKREDFISALESLYINGNLSGRLHFRRDWPRAAVYIFGPELMKYDEDGPQDKEHRAKMEVEAEERRQVLLEALVDLEKKSVYHGSLQPEHVEKTVKRLGRKIALYVYADFVVDDIIPPGPGERNDKEEDESGESEGFADTEQAEDELSPTPVRSLPPLEEDIRPIDVAPAVVAPIAAAENGSGLNLGAKRNIVQVDFIYSEPVSYADLVAGAEKESDGDREKVVPQLGIEVTADPPVPILQSASASVAARPPLVQKPSLKMMFNQLAGGLVS